MARLIECDRCGETATIPKKEATRTGLIDIGAGHDLRDITTPPGWMTLPTLTYNPSDRLIARDGVIAGGEFCPGCVKALKKWREPIPRSQPER